jgi:hypothetical protein
MRQELALIAGVSEQCKLNPAVETMLNQLSDSHFNEIRRERNRIRFHGMEIHKFKQKPMRKDIIIRSNECTPMGSTKLPKWIPIPLSPVNAIANNCTMPGAGQNYYFWTGNLRKASRAWELEVGTVLKDSDGTLHRVNGYIRYSDWRKNNLNANRQPVITRFAGQDLDAYFDSKQVKEGFNPTTLFITT